MASHHYTIAPAHLQHQHQYQLPSQETGSIKALNQQAVSHQQTPSIQTLSRSSSPIFTTHPKRARHSISYCTHTSPHGPSLPIISVADISYPLSYVRTPMPQLSCLARLPGQSSHAKDLEFKAREITAPIWEEKGPTGAWVLDGEGDMVLERRCMEQRRQRRSLESKTGNTRMRWVEDGNVELAMIGLMDTGQGTERDGEVTNICFPRH
ncbi:hypothetical protein T440DRAFT_66603 [Plenodomus tracheiphilus IPT5]|uniref:Uncharacterized protein n=1 Tax=Plenodomus tracheiphilus IPT5 TaxID=1408161 RepID=A0A6A7BB12_9PLEO|nr:hypothetical protein T440DRAFT_66603 [Plenodomus tracheiphilus IPT5]